MRKIAKERKTKTRRDRRLKHERDDKRNKIKCRN